MTRWRWQYKETFCDDGVSRERKGEWNKIEDWIERMERDKNMKKLNTTTQKQNRNFWESKKWNENRKRKKNGRNKENKRNGKRKQKKNEMKEFERKSRKV